MYQMNTRRNFGKQQVSQEFLLRILNMDPFIKSTLQDSNILTILTKGKFDVKVRYQPSSQVNSTNFPNLIMAEI